MNFPTTVVLTGVSRGIGMETAKLLLAHKVYILGLGHRPQSVQKAQKILDPLGNIHFLIGDIGQKETALKISQWVSEQWGSLDCLINNAGIQTYSSSIVEEGTDVLEQTFQVNLFGPHYLIQSLIPLLRKGVNPRIINVSSGAGTIKAIYSSKDMPAYRLSKYTLNGLTAFYSKALKDKIAVNSLDPGWLKTDLGGPNAPGEPIDGAKRIIALLQKPHTESGKFWYGSEEIPF